MLDEFTHSRVGSMPNPWHRLTAVLTLVLGLCLGMPAAHAAEAQPTSADPALEARVMALASELRCLVCQNQTIADSHADLAIDLRNQVREMLQRGDSPEQVKAYMTDRYGDFVLYRPPVKNTTALLWYGPAALLVLAVIVLIWVIRRRSRLPADRFEDDPDEADIKAS